MERAKLEVHWITYYAPFFPTEKDGEEGWATVHSDDPSHKIFYGGDDLGLKTAMFQAQLTNRYHGHVGPVKVVKEDQSLANRYRPYQWMTPLRQSEGEHSEPSPKKIH